MTTFEIFEERGEGQKQYWWRLVAGNRKIQAGSTEGYSRRRDAVRAIDAFATAIKVMYSVVDGQPRMRKR